MTEFLINAFVTLIVTVDPIGLAPIFLALTTGASSDAKRSVGVRAVIISTSILLVFLVAGGQLLSLLGISLAAFRIAGGLLLFWIAFEMVFEKRQQRKSKTAEQAHDDQTRDISDLAVFPLALPLTAGPGAISAVILLSADAPDIVATAGLAVAVLATMLLVLIGFLAAEKLTAFVSEAVLNVITRLLGVLLAALSVQFVLDGLSSAGF